MKPFLVNDENIQCGELAHVCEGRVRQGADFVVAQVTKKKTNKNTTQLTIRSKYHIVPR